MKLVVTSHQLPDITNAFDSLGSLKTYVSVVGRENQPPNLNDGRFTNPLFCGRKAFIQGLMLAKAPPAYLCHNTFLQP